MQKKYIIIATTFLAVLILVVALEKTHVINLVHSNNIPVTTGPSAEEQANAAVDAENKKNLVEGTKPNGDNSTSPTPTPEAQTPSIDLSARSETNGAVTVFTKLYNLSGGSCLLTVTNGMKQNQQTAAVGYQPEYSSCAGFSVPISALGSGNWSINLVVNSNGQSYSKTISYQTP